MEEYLLREAGYLSYPRPGFKATNPFRTWEEYDPDDSIMRV
jgi:hypothetical protein